MMPQMDAALVYHGLGWSIIAIPHGQKKATIKWKPFQTQRPGEAQLRKWFGNGQALNMAVVLGPVSGGLACRDFDKADSYEAWAAAYPDLAKLLPTVKTARGYHVYFPASIEGIRKLDDGELRGSRGYCLLPPSVHPDGPEYKWLIPPTSENLIVVDPVKAGFLPIPDKPARFTQQTQANTKQCIGTDVGREGEVEEGVSTPVEGEGVEEELDGVVEGLIHATLPQGPGVRNRQVFELARALKSLPRFADADPDQLRRIVERWHRLALPKIRTQEFEETWIDFLVAWPRVRYRKGEEPMQMMFQRAVEGEPPQIAVAKYPNNLRLQILVSLCRELQRSVGDRPFYLSCRTVGRLFSVTQTTGGGWLFLLRHDGILRVMEKGKVGKKSRRATTFRYLGD